MTPEAIECCGMVGWWRRSYPTYADYLIRINNGGRRNASQRHFDWKMGEVSGASDYFLAIPCGEYHGLFLEMKSKTGRPEPHQLRFLRDVQRSGYMGIVAYGDTEARDILAAWMNEKPEKIAWLQTAPRKKERNKLRKERDKT